MIELPEARVIAKDLRETILGKVIVDVRGNYIDHKFTFYDGNPNEYAQMFKEKKVTNVIPRNFYVEIEIEDYILFMRDGANIRYYDNRNDFPDKSKLLIEFKNGSFLNVTTSMYSCIGVYKKNDGSDNKYYNLELDGTGALDKEFTYEYFKNLIDKNTLKLSIKAFIATEQRILGIGNGIAQDIMFNAKLHPKRKMNTLNEEEIKTLYETIINTINEMVKANGRDTEKTIFDEFGKYKTKLSSKSYKDGCRVCKSEIKKEQYLGGSIYYCPNCQK